MKIRTIQLRIAPDTFKQLEKIKGDRTWEDFLVEAGLNYVKVKEAS